MDPFPLGPTVQASYRTVRDGLDRLIGAGALWLAILLLLDAILRLFESGEPQPAADTTGPSQVEVVTFVVQYGATLLAMAALAVVWHRQVLRGEPAGDRMAPVDAAVFRYVGMTVLIALLALMPVGLVLSLLTQATGGTGPGMQLMALPLMLAGAVAWARMNLVLPAAAVGDAQMTVRRSWDRTRGQGLKLLGGIVLTILPTALVALLVASIAAAIVGDTPILRALPRAVLVAGNLIETALVTTFLSFAYRRLWDERRSAEAGA